MIDDWLEKRGKNLGRIRVILCPFPSSLPPNKSLLSWGRRLCVCWYGIVAFLTLLVIMAVMVNCWNQWSYRSFPTLMVLWFTQHSAYTGAFWTLSLPRAQYCSCGALFYKKNKTYMAKGTSEKIQWQKDQLKTVELKAAKLFLLLLFVLTVKKATNLQFWFTWSCCDS